jgi:hypothetical protein
MWPRYETITDLKAGADLLTARRCGVIEAAGGHFQRIVLRPFPTLVSAVDTFFLGGWCHGHREGDRCRVYFNQPRRFQNFLAVKYVLSDRGTGYDTCRRVFEALDEVARIKGIDALLCDLANRRITESIARRWGWEPHKPSLWHRHYIKRFYGEYPARAKWLES